MTKGRKTSHIILVQRLYIQSFIQISGHLSLRLSSQSPFVKTSISSTFQASIEPVIYPSSKHATSQPTITSTHEPLINPLIRPTFYTASTYVLLVHLSVTQTSYFPSIHKATYLISHPSKWHRSFHPSD